MSANAKAVRPKPFSAYVDDLVGLLGPDRRVASKTVDLALDGGTAAAFRRSVPLKSRRSSGAFFTGREMAERLIDAESRPSSTAPIADPACGAGDLLLAAAKHLPRKSTALGTLEAWGRVLVGRDLDDELVRVARLRLALLAAQLSETKLSASEERIALALPGVRSGDGRALSYGEPVLMVLNPPFGTVVADTEWGSGRLSRAAVFAAECFAAAPEGSLIRAILPDVLRSGSNSKRWRDHVAAMIGGVDVETWGQFDSWTDVDVFFLRARRDKSEGTIDWWPKDEDAETVGESFSVHVGVVVPHRDPELGPKSPYLCARSLPQKGEHIAGEKRRRHPGTRFEAPFVAIRRTSRPADGGQRVIATLVRAPEPVLVENHLIVCVPSDGTLASCRALIKTLTSTATTDMLDQRIRCRHLTVSAIKEIPYKSR